MMDWDSPQILRITFQLPKPDDIVVLWLQDRAVPPDQYELRRHNDFGEIIKRDATYGDCHQICVETRS